MADSLNYSIRSASPGDVDKVARFLEPFVRDQQILPRTTDELATLIKNGFLAEANGQIVGFAAVEVYSTKLAELQCLCVAPDFRRAGIGKELVRRCVERASELHVCELMAITASESLFFDCGFHYSLPNQKRALFIQTKDRNNTTASE